MPIIPEMPEILIINFGKGASHTGSRSTTGSNGVLGRFRLVGQIGLVRIFGRKRRRTEEGKESF